MAKLIVPVMPEFNDLPDGVQALRDPRWRAFVWAYTFNGGDGAKAARAAGFSDASEGAKVRAHVLLQRQDILDALREMGARYLFSLAPKALFRLGQLLDRPDHRHHAKAIDMTLSRTGFVERTGVDVNLSGEVRHVDHTTAAVEDLRRMRAMGVPQAQLEKVFGFSGLSRYEKLLAAEDAKLIEATAVEHDR